MKLCRPLQPCLQWPAELQCTQILLSSRLEMGTTAICKCREWRWGTVATPMGQQAPARQSQSRPWDKLLHGR